MCLQVICVCETKRTRKMTNHKLEQYSMQHTSLQSIYEQTTLRQAHRKEVTHPCSTALCLEVHSPSQQIQYRFVPVSINHLDEAGWVRIIKVFLMGNAFCVCIFSACVTWFKTLFMI